MLPSKPLLRPGWNTLKVPSPNNYCFCGSQKKYKKCCLGMMVGFKGGGAAMLRQEIGGIDIFRPRIESEGRVKLEAESYLRQGFEPGTYTSLKAIDAIIKRQVDFYGEKFDSLVPLLASREFMDFLMYQYDQAGQLDDKEKSGTLYGEAYRLWLELGRTYKRALKYMAERTTMLAEAKLPGVQAGNRLALLDEAFICAEQLVGLCILSDQSRLFNTSTQIIIQPPGRDTYLDHSVSDSRFDLFNKRLAFHRAEAQRCMETCLIN